MDALVGVLMDGGDGGGGGDRRGFGCKGWFFSLE